MPQNMVAVKHAAAKDPILEQLFNERPLSDEDEDT